MGRSRDNHGKLLSQKLKNANKRELVTPRIEKLLSKLDPNDAESLLEIALNYLSFEDHESASHWLSGSAKLGNREAMFFLGRLELKAKSDPRWLIRAAELGDADAVIMIANYFSKAKRGLGDLDLAVYWFECLIERGELQVWNQYFDVFTRSRERRYGLASYFLRR
jgi:TPR repeat protein